MRQHHSEQPHQPSVVAVVVVAADGDLALTSHRRRQRARTSLLPPHRPRSTRVGTLERRHPLGHYTPFVEHLPPPAVCGICYIERFLQRGKAVGASIWTPSSYGI
jgi:hypothetical protein